MQRPEDARRAIFSLSKECANKEIETPRSCEKKRVGISGCDPLMLRILTTIAQMAVDSLDILPLLAVSIIPKESAEKNPGLNASHHRNIIIELIISDFCK
jgi:hypothetical protein